MYLFQEEYRERLAGLEQQVACLEDELCEARLLASKLKTDLVSERSTSEVRLAEMQSRLNEVYLSFVFLYDIVLLFYQLKVKTQISKLLSYM